MKVVQTLGESEDESVVEITAEDIAGGQKCEKPTEHVSGSAGNKTEPTEIKRKSVVVEITAQDVSGEQEFEEPSDNGSQVTPKEPEIQADNNQSEASEFYAIHGKEHLVMNFISGESQSESEPDEVELDSSPLHKSKHGAILEQKDKPQIIKVPLSEVSPSEYTILGSKSVQCNNCLRCTKSVDSIRKHIRQSHRDKITLYICPFCPYTNRFGVSKHIIGAHKSYDELECFECHTCGKKFKFKCKLIRHIKTHRTMEELMQTNELFKCLQCPKMFRFKSKLTRHTARCHNTDKEQKEMQCCHCSYRCRERKSLLYHIQKRHTPVAQLKTLKCNKCDFTTKFYVDLNKHKTNYHAQSLQCEKCPYQTISRTSLRDHQMTHKILQKEDKKYACDKCDYRTYKSYSLKAHSWTHLKPEERQYFYCHHCNFKGSRKDYLIVHVARHFEKEEVEFQCHICDFRTKKRKIFSLHIGWHKKNHKL